MNRWIRVATIVLTSLVCTNQVQAGTASYLAKCSFLDRGNNNGGNVSDMPCYAVEGGNVYGAFFHIDWDNGIRTELNAKPDGSFTDAVTGRTFERVGGYTFVADDDGDLIILDDLKRKEL